MQYSSHQRISNSTFCSETFRSRPTPGWRNSRRTWNSAGFLPGNTIRRFFFSLISCVSILWKTGDANIRTAECVLISVAASSSNITVMSCVPCRNPLIKLGDVRFGSASVSASHLVNSFLLPPMNIANQYIYIWNLPYIWDMDGYGLSMVIPTKWYQVQWSKDQGVPDPVLHECPGTNRRGHRCSEPQKNAGTIWRNHQTTIGCVWKQGITLKFHGQSLSHMIPMENCHSRW